MFDPETHVHKFKRYNIAFLGIRWQCTDPDCQKIANACFTPKDEYIDRD